jgi:hypothetical protein
MKRCWVFLFSLLAPTVFAANFTSGAAVIEAARKADRIEIAALGVSGYEPISIITDLHVIEAILNDYRFPDPPPQEEKKTDDKNVIGVKSYEQSIGEFRLSFSYQQQEIVSFSVHRHRFIRVAQNHDDFYLTEGSGVVVGNYLDVVLKLFKERKARANQAPVPTAPSVTPAPDAPVAPAAAAAHL